MAGLRLFEGHSIKDTLIFSSSMMTTVSTEQNSFEILQFFIKSQMKYTCGKEV